MQPCVVIKVDVGQEIISYLSKKIYTEAAGTELQNKSIYIY